MEWGPPSPVKVVPMKKHESAKERQLKLELALAQARADGHERALKTLMPVIADTGVKIPASFEPLLAGYLE